MGNIVLGMTNSYSLAKSIARVSKTSYMSIDISNFPDGETYLRFPKSVNGKNVFIVQSLNPNPNKSLIELIFAGRTAKDLGAKNVHSIIPYLAYMRQDKRFNSGECLSSKVIGNLLSSFNSIITIDPHLHRYKNLGQVFKIKSVKLSATQPLATFIKNNFQNSLIVGPDIESFQWVSLVANQINFPFTVLKKKRFSSRKVRIKDEGQNFKGKKVVIVDDVISSGHTIIETAKLLKRRGASQINVICTHGIFSEDALLKIKKEGVNQVVSTNTIHSKVSKINIASLFLKIIKK